MSVLQTLRDDLGKGLDLTGTVTKIEGSVLNVGDDFEATIKLTNVTSGPFNNVKLVLESTQWATLKEVDGQAVNGGTKTFTVGTLAPGTGKDFHCKFHAEKAAPSGYPRPETYVKATASGNGDLTALTAAVQNIESFFAQIQPE